MARVQFHPPLRRFSGNPQPRRTNALAMEQLSRRLQGACRGLAGFSGVRIGSVIMFPSIAVFPNGKFSLLDGMGPTIFPVRKKWS